MAVVGVEQAHGQDCHRDEPEGRAREMRLAGRQGCHREWHDDEDERNSAGRRQGGQPISDADRGQSSEQHDCHMRGEVTHLKKMHAPPADREADRGGKPDGLFHPLEHRFVGHRPPRSEPMDQADQPAGGDKRGQVEADAEAAGCGEFHRRQVHETEQVDDRHLLTERPVALLDHGAPGRGRQVGVHVKLHQAAKHVRAVSRSSGLN